MFVTFEERAGDIRRNFLGFGWDIAGWEAEKKWAFVDASIQPGEPVVVTGDFDLGALIARIEHAIHKVGARRISLDSLGGIFTQFEPGRIRHEIFRLTAALMSVTADADRGACRPRTGPSRAMASRSSWPTT